MLSICKIYPAEEGKKREIGRKGAGKEEEENFLILIFILCAWVFCLYVYLCIKCMPAARRRQNRMPQPLELELDHGEPPCGYLGSNLGRLEEQQVLLAAQSSPVPKINLYKEVCLLLLYACVCPHVCQSTTCLQCLRRLEEGTRFPATGIRDSCEQPRGC